MSVSRLINSKFWSDSFVVDKLNPLDRYLFLYFLTNEKTNICGVYELPLRTISNETGIEKEEIVRMLERLKGKVEYKDGWVNMVNFVKHQNTKSKDVQTGINRQIDELPTEIREWIGGSREGLGTVPRQPEVFNLTKLNLTKENTLSPLPAETVSKEIKNTNTKKDMTWNQYKENEIQLDEDFVEEVPENKKNKVWDKEAEQEWINKKIESKLDYEALFGSYVKNYTDLNFPTRQVADFTFGRNKKASQFLVKNFTPEQITKTLKYCKSTFSNVDWNLETVKKQISKVITLK